MKKELNMKSKIHVEIDTELLDIIKNCSDSDLDSIIQDALAQFIGIKQIWVKADTFEPISTIPTLIPPKIVPVGKTINETEPVDETVNKITKRRRQPKYVLKIWETLKSKLGTEFTINEYWDATKKCDLGYKDSARHSTILEHLRLVEEAGKIVQMGTRPKTYRKLDDASEQGQIKESKETTELKETGSKTESKKIGSKESVQEQIEPEKIEPRELLEQSESIQQGPKLGPEEELHKIIEYGKNIQNKERNVNKSVLL